MSWKLVIVGGLVFWVVTNIVGMFGTGLVIHERILDPIYRAHESFWLPELRQDPPDMAALLPQWLAMSLLASLVYAGVYSVVRGCFKGPGWKQGLKFGFCLALIAIVFYLSLSGIFDLPLKMWIWWGVDALVLFLLGGAAMGWAGAKFAES